MGFLYSVEDPVIFLKNKLSVRFRDGNWTDLSSLLGMEGHSSEEGQREVQLNFAEVYSEDCEFISLLESSAESISPDGTLDKNFGLEETDTGTCDTFPPVKMYWEEGEFLSAACHVSERK